jgi:lysophospholipase L1-like esterase
MISRNLLLLAASLLLTLPAAAVDPAAPSAPAAPPKTIVMIGDSITHGGKWDELLARPEVLSWGIPGYTTGQLAWTFKDIVREHPAVKIVFLNGGINDLSLGIPADRVYENQVKAIAWWRERHVIPVIESTILQVEAPDTNVQITGLNARLRTYCEANQIRFVDLNAVLAPDGHLRAELSLDGTHLKPEAYPLWARLIQDCLRLLGR